MPKAGYRAKDYTGILQVIADVGGEVSLPHDAIKGYGPNYLVRHGLGKWLRNNEPRNLRATGFAITDAGRCVLSQREKK